MKKNNMIHLKFHNVPKAKINSKVNEIKLYEEGEPYGVSVCGFWHKQTLNDLCVHEESAWDFEINSAIRSKKFGITGSLLKPPFYCLNLIEKGKWSRPN